MNLKWNHKSILGFSDIETAMFDFDNASFKTVKYWALRTMKWFKLGGFIILKSSENHYHVVFNRKVSWSENMHIVAWVSLLSHNKSIQKWQLMQCIKESSTLRVSPKREKPSPRIVYRYGKQDGQVEEFLRYRRLIKKMQKRLARVSETLLGRIENEFVAKRLPPVEEILELKRKGYTYKQMIEKFREEGRATDRISPNSLATKVKRYRQKKKRDQQRLEAQKPSDRTVIERPSSGRNSESIVESEGSASKKPIQELIREDLRVHNPLPPNREVPKERENNVSSSSEKCPDCGAETWKWTARGADAGLWYCPEC